jgi:hypothetical protein
MMLDHFHRLIKLHYRGHILTEKGLYFTESSAFKTVINEREKDVAEGMHDGTGVALRLD